MGLGYIEASCRTRDQGFGDAQDPHGRHAKELTRSAAPLAFNEDESGGADADADFDAIAAELRSADELFRAITVLSRYVARHDAPADGRVVRSNTIARAAELWSAQGRHGLEAEVCCVLRDHGTRRTGLFERALLALSDGAFNALMQYAISAFVLQERNSLVAVSAFLVRCIPPRDSYADLTWGMLAARARPPQLQPHIPHARRGRAIGESGTVDGIGSRYSPWVPMEASLLYHYPILLSSKAGMDDNTSQAQLIAPPLRYTVLGITIFLAVIYAISVKHPSTQLHHLQKSLGTTEATIRTAKLQCPRDHLALKEQGVLLLE
ncbi:hypothetical protein FB451DRAFT_1389399 [Mycena latifolia]|nr:hypothetical protein FB451DRAFT_1389399 [Mycena latifolia]